MKADYISYKNGNHVHNAQDHGVRGHSHKPKKKKKSSHKQVRTFNEMKDKLEKQKKTEIQFEKLQQHQEARKKRMVQRKNGRDEATKDTSYRLATSSGPPVVVTTGTVQGL